MKKVLSTLVVLAMLLTLAAGGVAEEEPIKLTAWAWDKNVDSMIEAARLYTELTGIAIDIDVQVMGSGDCVNAIIAACESGDLSSLPDIYLSQDDELYGLAKTYDGIYYDVTDYVDWTQVAAAKAGLTTVDGVHYGIPFDSGSAIAMYRVDILEQAGYTIADLEDITWDRAIEIGADVYEKTGYYLYSDNAILNCMIFSSGTPLFNDDGSANIADNAAVKLALETLKKGVDANAIYESSDWNDFIASFTGGKVCAGVIQGCWIANNVNTAPDQAGLWDCASLPALDIEGASHNTNSGGSSWVVFANSPNADAAAKMIAYIFAGEGSEAYADFETYDIGYITTWKPIAESDYYDKVDDGFYPVGFWTKVAATAGLAPEWESSILYATAKNALSTAKQAVLTGTSVEDAMAEAQEVCDFEFGG